MSADAGTRRAIALNATRLTRLARGAAGYAFAAGALPPLQGGGRPDFYARDMGVHLAVRAFGLSPMQAGAEAGLTPAAAEAAHLMFESARGEFASLDRYLESLTGWLRDAPPAWGAGGAGAAAAIEDSPEEQAATGREPAAKQGRAARGSGEDGKEARKRVNPADFSEQGGA